MAGSEEAPYLYSNHKRFWIHNDQASWLRKRSNRFRISKTAFMLNYHKVCFYVELKKTFFVNIIYFSRRTVRLCWPAVETSRLYLTPYTFCT